MSTRTRRTRRTRVFVAATLAAAALTLTACRSGEGVLDEGAPAGSASTSAPAASTTSPSRTSGGTPAGPASEGATGGAAGSQGAKDPGSTRTPCSSTSTRTTATEVSRPLNHLLLTVTNTGSKNCDLVGRPAVRFGEAQSVPPAFEDSKPQAVVTLAPGESGYASVLLSAADGSGSNGYTATSLEVFLDDGASAAHPSLPAKGVYVDDSVTVSYWQSTMADALAW
ncbi:DUF4232 domain-containing protein [Streptomyces sp. NPDC001388]|uniref:DUF4232 domain-containing protein n=1 Tax=Streptomyces sp. NPDC001388 TaxID=3364568 RepID=UPI00369E0B9D